MIQDYCRLERKEKKMKKIKILTITLLIAVITMVAFIGVYTKVQNRMENQVKDYDLAMDLKGSRNIRLKVSTGNQTKMKDAEGKEVEDSESLTDEQITEKGYTKEEVPYNSEEIKTIENYQASQKILEKRLEKLGVTNYVIKLDDTTGDIIIELTENDGTDNVISNLYTQGKFEIVDSETKEVLMDNKDIKQARVMYGSGNSTGTSRGTNVYLDIEFTKEGRQKLEQISSQYVKEERTEENTTNNETTAEGEAEETATEKKITMNIDDSEIMSTSFEEPVRTGKLQLSIGTASTDQKTLQGYIEQATSMATVLDTGNMPIKYDLDENQYILTDITNQEMEIAICVVALIVALALIAFMVRDREKGILGVISYIGFISVLLLVIRYANVTIAIEGFVGIIMTLILNYILVNQLIKTEETSLVYKDFFIKIIPVIIMVITFCFMKWVPISSFGMTMIWGIALMALYNGILTNNLLKIGTRKEK